MKTIGKYLPLILVLAAGVIFQGIFIFADKTDTPKKAAVEFAKAYYLLNEDAMMAQLCKTAINHGVVGDYMYKMAQAASDRGFKPKYLKSRLYKIHVETVENIGDNSKVRITGERRTAMNPLYEYVALIFGFGQPKKVDVMIDLVKENKQWKVCEETFDLT